MGYNWQKIMKTMKCKVLVALLFVFGTTSTFAQNYRVVGSISGTINAGETFELYKSSASSVLDYLSGWKDVGPRDRTESYSVDQIYNICMQKAKKQYHYYSDIQLKELDFEVKYQDISDTTYYSNEVGSGIEYKRTNRSRKIYKYSATVVVNE